jgi:hypothetical protein
MSSAQLVKRCSTNNWMLDSWIYRSTANWSLLKRWDVNPSAGAAKTSSAGIAGIPWRALANEAVIVSSFAATTGSSAHAPGISGILVSRSRRPRSRRYNALALVIAGLGVTFVPGLPEHAKQNLVVREIQAPRLYLETAVAYKMDARPSRAAFLDVVTKIRARPILVAEARSIGVKRRALPLPRLRYGFRSV